MKTELHIDTSKHLSFSKRAEKCIQTQLIKDFSEQDAEKYWDKTCRIFEGYLKDLPYSGGKQNPMWDDLYDSLAIFAYYEALPEPKPTVAKMDEIISENFNGKHLPSWIRPGKKTIKTLIALFYRLMADKMNAKIDSGEWGFNWKMYHPEDLDGIPAIGLVGCPIADFAREHGFNHLMPAMCNSDYAGMRNLNILLVRPRTVALGYKTCDYYLTPLTPGNEAKYPIQRNGDGFLLNGLVEEG